MDERLIYEVLSVVEEIPPGTVVTYGQIVGAQTLHKNMRPVFSVGPHVFICIVCKLKIFQDMKQTLKNLQF